MSAEPIVLAGGYGSPYTVKMRAVLRYRQIPFRWVPRDSEWDDLPPAPVPIIPVIAYPDGAGGYADVTVDSSPQIMRLEGAYDGRSVVPADPALAFLDTLIEDFGDEWLTKAMYHYRWTYEPDIDKAGKLLPLNRDLRLDSDGAQASYAFITARQIARREMVGSTELNTPIIEGSYRRVLEALTAQFSSHDFLLGDRPGRGDFGVFGQLSQLVGWDPTSVEVAARHAPKVIAWVHRLDDLGWLPIEDDGGWLDVDQLPGGTRRMLDEIGRTYAPFMVANAAALMSGTDEVVCDIDGQTYRQAPFKYQGKCLQWLRADYAALADRDRERVEAALAGTGCEVLFG